MDRRILLIIVAVGFMGLAWAPTLQPPPRLSLGEALERPGPVRIEGIVRTLREGDGRTLLLVDDGETAWVAVEGSPSVAPGDRVRLDARRQGGMLQADVVEVVEAAGPVLLRQAARAPWAHEGPITVRATVGEVYETVMYLRDGGHRLRVVPAEVDAFEAAEGDRVVAEGRFVYDGSRVGFVLRLDGIADA